MGDVAAGLAAAFVLSSLLAGIAVGITGDEEVTLGTWAVSAVGLWAGLVVVTVRASRRKGTGSLADDFWLRGERLDVLKGVALGVAAQVVLVNLVALVLRPLIGRPEVEGSAQRLIEGADAPAPLLLVVVIVVVGAPVVEELFFRGLVLHAVRRRFGAVAAVAASSALFGLTHLQDLPGDALVLVITTLTALGALLAVVTLRTGRLTPAVVAHMTFNAFTVFALTSR